MAVADSRERWRRQKLRQRYGITPEQWDALYEAQAGRCAICEAEVCPSGRRFHVDHDHATGKVRGLLCYICNTHVGWVESGWLDKAEAYLKKAGER